jgi:hypothetical protein
MIHRMNRQTHSLAQRVRDDFRLLSADTRLLLQQALQRDLPDARDRLMDRAHRRIDSSRDWIRSSGRAIRRDPRTPYVVGALGLALVATLVWATWRQCRCDAEGCRREMDEE